MCSVFVLVEIVLRAFYVVGMSRIGVQTGHEKQLASYYCTGLMDTTELLCTLEFSNGHYRALVRT